MSYTEVYDKCNVLEKMLKEYYNYDGCSEKEKKILDKSINKTLYDILATGLEEEFYKEKENVKEEAIPVEFITDNFDTTFICEADEMREWCDKHCDFSEAQPECILRYIAKVWRKH